MVSPVGAEEGECNRDSQALPQRPDHVQRAQSHGVWKELWSALPVLQVASVEVERDRIRCIKFYMWGAAQGDRSSTVPAPECTPW